MEWPEARSIALDDASPEAETAERRELLVTPLRPSDAALRGRGGIWHALEASRGSFNRCHAGRNRPEHSRAAEIQAAGGDELRLV